LGAQAPQALKELRFIPMVKNNDIPASVCSMVADEVKGGQMFDLNNQNFFGFQIIFFLVIVFLNPVSSIDQY